MMERQRPSFPKAGRGVKRSAQIRRVVPAVLAAFMALSGTLSAGTQAVRVPGFPLGGGSFNAGAGRAAPGRAAGLLPTQALLGSPLPLQPAGGYSRRPVPLPLLAAPQAAVPSPVVPAELPHAIAGIAPAFAAPPDAPPFFAASRSEDPSAAPVSRVLGEMDALARWAHAAKDSPSLQAKAGADLSWDHSSAIAAAPVDASPQESPSESPPTNAQLLEKFISKLDLQAADIIHINGLLRKFQNIAAKVQLHIGSNFLPSALLTPEERARFLGAVGYGAVRADASNTQAARDVVVTFNPMDGGLGTSVKRESYLEKTLGRAKNDAKTGRARIGAKATDLHFNVRLPGAGKPVQVSVAELKLLRILKEASQYRSVVFQPLVNKDSAPSYERLLDSIFLPDRVDDSIPAARKRTYRQVMDEKGVRLAPGADEMLHQMDLPIIDIGTGLLTDKYTAPGGHGQWGVRLLFDALNFKLPEDGKTHIRAFFNGDGMSNLPDASITGWMAKEKVAMVMITTTKAGLDKKGGQIGIQRLPDGTVRPQILELAQAKKASPEQERLFYAIGLPGQPRVRGTDARGRAVEYSNDVMQQYFNTNIALANYNVLTPLLQDVARLKDVEFEGELLSGAALIERIITPDLIENEKEKSDGKKYTQLEGAISSALLNLNAFFTTSRDPRVRDILAKRGITQLLRIINVDTADRTSFFTPVKNAFDFWFQAYSDYYRFDARRWALRDARAGQIPPSVEFSGTKKGAAGEPKPEDFYQDVQNVIDAFGAASTKALGALSIEGVVLLRDAVLKGDVRIVNRSGVPCDLNSPRARRALHQKKGKPLVLENIRITIDEAGQISSDRRVGDPSGDDDPRAASTSGGK